jgi:hypothetical protein
MALNLVRLLEVLKNDFGEADDAMFKVSKGYAKSFSASCASNKRLGRCYLSDD